jgi:hypothetical protein
MANLNACRMNFPHFLPSLLYRQALERGDSAAEAERWQEHAERMGKRVMG